MLERCELDEAEADRAFAAVPIPAGCEWVFDAAASGDRLRLEVVGIKGYVGAVYADGDWFVDDPQARHRSGAQGSDGDLASAMRRLLTVARALGFAIPEKP